MVNFQVALQNPAVLRCATPGKNLKWERFESLKNGNIWKEQHLLHNIKLSIKLYFFRDVGYMVAGRICESTDTFILWSFFWSSRRQLQGLSFTHFDRFTLDFAPLIDKTLICVFVLCFFWGSLFFGRKIRDSDRFVSWSFVLLRLRVLAKFAKHIADAMVIFVRRWTSVKLCVPGSKLLIL